MRTKYKTRSREEKLSILRNYYSSGMSKGSFDRKYGIDVRSLNRWIQIFSKEIESLSLPCAASDDNMGKLSKDEEREEIALLKKRNKELEKALAFSKLEIKARDIMIDIAEESFNIPIRKKSGVK